MRTWKPWPESNRTPSGTRFAGGQLHLELTKATSAPGRNRTAGLQIRNLARYPLRYEGMVQEVGFEPTQRCTCFTGRPDSPTSALPRGDRAELNRRLQGHNLALCH